MPPKRGKQVYKSRSKDGAVEKHEANNLKFLYSLYTQGKLGEIAVARVAGLSKKGRKQGAHGIFELSLNGEVSKDSYVTGKCIQFAALAKDLRAGDLVLIEPEGDNTYMIHLRLKTPADIAEMCRIGAKCAPAFLEEDVFEDGVDVDDESALAAVAAEGAAAENEVNIDDL
jgi:hypothetical protein